jgi:peptidoglycan/LPS O-acetylase OafA/YrhL
MVYSRMKNTKSQTKHYHILDGLRGFAALQVVALHYIAAFLPAIYLPIHYYLQPELLTPTQTFFNGSPLFYLWDGFSAVYVFFLLSGFVLSHAYEKRTTHPFHNMVGRSVRLIIPAWASLIIAAICFIIFPDDIREAARLSHSFVLAEHDIGLPLWHSFMREIFESSIFLGYDAFTLLDTVPHIKAQIHVLNSNQALNFPLWSLHFEFYGSLFIIGLMYLRARVKILYFASAAIITLLMPASPFYLFFIGHAAYIFFKHYISRPSTNWRFLMLGYAFISLGVLITSSKKVPLLTPIYEWTKENSWYTTESDFRFQGQVGAICIFFGIILVAPIVTRLNMISRLLRGKFLQLAGKYSFSIYLLHSPILLTLGCFVYNTMHPSMPAYAATLMAAILGLAVTLVLVILFERYIDRLAIAFGHRITSRRKPGK